MVCTTMNEPYSSRRKNRATRKTNPIPYSAGKALSAKAHDPLPICLPNSIPLTKLLAADPQRSRACKPRRNSREHGAQNLADAVQFPFIRTVSKKRVIDVQPHILRRAVIIRDDFHHLEACGVQSFFELLPCVTVFLE